MTKTTLLRVLLVVLVAFSVGLVLGNRLSSSCISKQHPLIMLVQWVERIGQFLAPDPTYQQSHDPDAADPQSLFWQMVAPDPKFTPPPPPPPPSTTKDSSDKKTVNVQHAKTAASEKQVMFSPTMTVRRHPSRVGAGGENPAEEISPQADQQVPIPATPPKQVTKSPYYARSPYSSSSAEQQLQEGDFVNKKNAPAAGMMIAGSASSSSKKKKKITPRKTPIIHDIAADLSVEVTEAIKRVAETRRYGADRRKDLVGLFGRMATALPLKARKILSTRVKQDPTLLTRRSYKSVLETNCPDGSTLFLAAIFDKQIPNVKLLWEIAVEISPDDAKYQLQCTNTIGETAWHYAAQTGSDELLSYVTNLYRETFGEDLVPPVDLTGYTPLATGITHGDWASNTAKKLLFDRADPTVTGCPSPASERSVSAANAMVGLAELNGERCAMEDYSVADVVEDENSNHTGASVLLVAVADGHGDQGEVAQFVANNFIGAIRTMKHPIEDWTEVATKVCLSLDDELRTRTKRKMLFGGAAAIFAAVTPNQIIVANVGDSRAVLIQKPKSPQVVEGPTTCTVEELSEATEVLSLTKKAPEDPSSSSETTKTKPVVVPLSFDHKPDRADERARVEKVDKMIVEEMSYQIGGETVAIARIKDTSSKAGSGVAFSRSFGDFEYKNQKHLDPSLQAVIAVPEVTIRTREDDNDLFVVLACDGVWDVMTNEDVANFCYQRRTMRPTEIADELVQEALKLESRDNLSAAVIDLRGGGEPSSSSSFDRTPKKLDFSDVPLSS
jgi:serine/threonine protein phosphatase PrpC